MKRHVVVTEKDEEDGEIGGRSARKGQGEFRSLIIDPPATRSRGGKVNWGLRRKGPIWEATPIDTGLKGQGGGSETSPGHSHYEGGLSKRGRKGVKARVSSQGGIGLGEAAEGSGIIGRSVGRGVGTVIGSCLGLGDPRAGGPPEGAEPQGKGIRDGLHGYTHYG